MLDKLCKALDCEPGDLIKRVEVHAMDIDDQVRPQDLPREIWWARRLLLQASKWHRDAKEDLRVAERSAKFHELTDTEYINRLRADVTEAANAEAEEQIKLSRLLNEFESWKLQTRLEIARLEADR